MANTNGKNNAIVKAQPQQLAVRHAWLVERGIHSLPILGITESRVKEFCSILEDSDFLNREKTLKTVVDLGTYIRSCRRHLDSLIFPLVENFYFCSEELERNRRASGRELHPREAEYIELSFKALEVLVGTLMSPDEAIMDVVCFGATAARIRAIEWLSDNRQRLTTTTHDLFSDYLRTMLLSTKQNTSLFLALKYADAEINGHIDEVIYFFIDKIILENMLEELKATARGYIRYLREKASPEVLIYAVGKLAESGDSTEQGTDLFFELKYSVAVINDRIDEAMYFFIDKIFHENIQGEPRITARDCIQDLSKKASNEALIYAVGKLAKSGDPIDVRVASSLFYYVVMYRKLEGYSDDDLEKISCFIGWLHNEKYPDEKYKVDKCKDLVMKEIKRRGLEG